MVLIVSRSDPAAYGVISLILVLGAATLALLVATIFLFLGWRFGKFLHWATWIGAPFAYVLLSLWNPGDAP
jgi:hypothetical protein